MNALSFLLILSIGTSYIVYGEFSPASDDVVWRSLLDGLQSDQLISPRKITPIMFLVPPTNISYCSSVDEFPNFFTETQRLRGAIVIPFLVGIYCFTLLAIVCDNYFLPCVEKICDFLNLSKDVAAATFMAMATSAPELFVNIIGTFLTESDIGIGTVVGSSMFNTLGCAALGGLAARTPIQIDWWPVTRDSFLYMVAISLLVAMSWDGKIFWYEGMILFIVYFVYFTLMLNNTRISTFMKRCFKKCSRKSYKSTNNSFDSDKSFDCSTPASMDLSTPPIYLVEEHIQRYNECVKVKDSTKTAVNRKIEFNELEKMQIEENVRKEAVNAYVELNQIKIDLKEETKNDDVKQSRRSLCCKKFMYFYTWPIKALLFCIIPDSVKRPKLFPITFILCIIIIGANSYIISWMITIIGHTFRISDSVLGLTFLAAGACLPEAISIIIMSRKGEGGMGISNALGANTMNILLSLGLPWFIKTMIIDGSIGDGSFIEIASGTIEYTILSLMLVVVALFVTLYLSKFRLQKRTGIILAVIYLIFLSATIVSQMIMLDSKPCS